ncbi:MAG: DUF4268 domain-containing protein [Halobacteriota archaeon]
MTIRKAIQQIDEKELLLPHIQRPFIWKQDKNHNQVKRFFDSILRDYPFGTLLFWRTRDQIQARAFIFDYHDGMNVRDTYLKSSEYKDKEKLLVLDGQQRLQALYIALKGTYEGKELYFDILSGGDLFWDLQDELRYNFEYLTPDEAARRSNHGSYWVLLKDIALSDEEWPTTKLKIFSKMQAAGIDTSDPDFQLKVDINGAKVVNRFATQELIYHYTIDSTIGKPISYDEILEIFIRANSGGTPLGKSDLMFSLIKLNWDSAEEEFDKLLDTINRQGAFRFDKDFILKTALVLIDKRAKFAVEKFKGTKGEENLKTIQHKWDRITESFRWLSDFLGYARITSDDTLPSYNALIPIVYYSFINNNKLYSKRVKNNIQTWLYSALLNGNFSGQSDGVIDTCTDVIKDHSAADHFPFQRLESTLRRKYNRIVGVNPSIIDSNTNLILNVVYLDNKEVINFQPSLRGNVPEVDHIFPKSKMLRTYKQPSSIVNNIGNYMLLEKTLNINKTNKLPERYFSEALQEQPEFYARNLIPSDPSLHQSEHFQEFVEARRALILETIKRVLVYTDDDGNLVLPTDEDYEVDEGLEDYERAGFSSRSALVAAHKEFIKGLVDRDKECAHSRYSLAHAKKVGLQVWYITRIRWLGIRFSIGSEHKAINKAVFDRLYSIREQIEEEFGSELLWYRQDHRKKSRIEYKFTRERFSPDRSKWPGIQDAMVEKFYSLVDAVYPYIIDFTEPTKYKFLQQTDDLGKSYGVAKRIDAENTEQLGLTVDYDMIEEQIIIWANIATGDKTKDKRIFDTIYANKSNIEDDFGDKLVWARNDDKDFSRLAFIINTEGTLDDESRWGDIQNKVIQAEIKLSDLLKSYFSPLY